jgi:hypothetical protein
VYILAVSAIDIGYRYRLNLRNATDRNGDSDEIDFP